MENINNNYCIKNGYTPNLNNIYYTDNHKKKKFWKSAKIYQPCVYKLAYKLAKKTHAKYIIDFGAGNGKKLRPFKNKYKIITIDFGDNCDILRKNINPYKIINCDFEKEAPKIEDDIIKNSIVIASDVIEHIRIPDNFIKNLSDISKKCKHLIISTPERDRKEGVLSGPPDNLAHVREWTLKEFSKLLKYYKFNNFLISHTISVNKRPHDLHTIMALSGTNMRSDSENYTKKTLYKLNKRLQRKYWYK